MQWNHQNISLLSNAVRDRYRAFFVERKTDRRNLSELWNKHLRDVGISLARPKKPSLDRLAISDLIDIINFKNEEVTDRLCVSNPDREGQFLFIPRDIAAKILVLGMP